MTKTPSKEQINNLITSALDEDIGLGDITSRSIVSPDEIYAAEVLTRENIVLCGLDILKSVFFKLDPDVSYLDDCFSDGDNIKSNTKILGIKGKGIALLEGERVALNILQRLCGIATLTKQYVEKADPVQILDTRKTTPGLRSFEKYAVFCGGGSNHRLNLSCGIMVKDNHINKITDEVADKLTTISPKIPIQFEVDSPKQINPQNVSLVDAFLLDNMTPNKIKECLEKINLLKNKDKNIFIEVSGGVTLKNISKFNLEGVNGISVGALTHQSTNVDIGLDLHS